MTATATVTESPQSPSLHIYIPMYTGKRNNSIATNCSMRPLAHNFSAKSNNQCSVLFIIYYYNLLVAICVGVSDGLTVCNDGCADMTVENRGEGADDILITLEEQQRDHSN